VHIVPIGNLEIVIYVNTWMFQMRNGLNEDARPGVLEDAINSNGIGLKLLNG
jgi:hypothetical protein